MGNVIKLIDHSNNSNCWDVKGMLEDALEEIENEVLVPTKGMAIFLDDINGKYHVSYSQCQMNMAECLALLEATKARIINNMRDLND